MLSKPLKRPIVRYHGGKWMLAPWIISLFPSHRTYCEPFGGGASVLLRKNRSFSEVYNDLDDEIVNLFQIARDRGSELRDALSLTPFSRVEFQNAYRKTDDKLEEARRCIIRSFMGFGSDGIHSSHRTGFRGRSQRSGTTPAHDWANFPKSFEAIVSRLQGVVIEHKPAIDVILKYDARDTLHYVDTPYVHSTRKRVDAARGYRHEMSDDDHRELSAVLKTLSGKVVLSGYPSALYEDLYGHWHRIERTGSFADGARQRTESLWLSPNITLANDLFSERTTH